MGAAESDLLHLRDQNDLPTDTLIDALHYRPYAPDFVHLLLKHPSATVNAQHSQTGRTALHMVAELGHDECIELLLKQADIDVNIVDKEKNTSLMCAARFGHIHSVGMISDVPGVLLNEQNSEGETALHLAARIRADCVSLLLLSNCDINTRNVRGETAFSASLIAKRTDATSAFLFMLEMPMRVGKFNAALAHSMNPTRIRYGLVKHTDIPIIRAATCSQPQSLKMLATDDTVNEVAIDGENALIMACQNGRVKQVAALLSNKKININVVTHLTKQTKSTTSHSDYREMGALMWAARNGHIDCLNLLLERTNDIRASLAFENSLGYSALHLAVFNSHSACVDALLHAERVSQLYRQRLHVYTLLLLHVVDARSCTSLLEAKAVVNAVCNSTGQTALHRAARDGCTEVVHVLVKYGAGRAILDADGNTAYACACHSFHHAVEDILGYSNQWVAQFSRSDSFTGDDVPMLYNYLVDPKTEQQDRNKRRVGAWKSRIQPLLALCGDQKCVAEKPFLKNLLQATKGTRELYKDEFVAVIKDGLSKLEICLNDFQATTIRQVPLGKKLAAIPIKQMFKSNYIPTPLSRLLRKNQVMSAKDGLLTQYSSEVLNASYATELRAALKDDRALIRFCKKHKLLDSATGWMDLTRDGAHAALDRPYTEFTHTNFRDYLPALMLVHQTNQLDQDFHRLVEALIRPIGVTYQSAPRKKLKRILEKSDEYEREHGCERAFGCQYVIDTVRGCISIPTLEKLHKTLDVLKKARLEKHKLEVRRIKNGHHPDAESVGGYRDIKVNLILDVNGARIFAELQLVFQRVLEIKHHMHLLYACDRGDF